MIVIVDANVAVVANEKSEQASPDCVLICIQQIERIIKEGQLILDDDWRIIREYMGNLRSQGEPGVGDQFLKWVLTNRSTGRCAFIPITPLKE